MKIEFHLIQNFAPANLNRDDSGLPKDCDFGGYRRARISSQCIKRSIRTSNAFSSRVEIGIRTRRGTDKALQILKDEFNISGTEAQLIGTAILEAVTKKVTDNKTQYLYFTDSAELKGIIEIFLSNKFDIDQDLNILADPDSKKSKKSAEALASFASKALDEYLKINSHRINSIDIALFGRMLADQPKMKIDAACQVAHAISTNKVSMDFDYFTAIDDLNPQEETGAGMIGNLGFNSSCFYRYAVIDTDQLMKNIGNKKDQAISGIIGFTEASIQALPTGKQNTFAAHNPPSFVLITARNSGMPISLANAFEKPATPFADKSLSDVSIEALISYFNSINSTYSIKYDFSSLFAVKGNYMLNGIGDYLADDYSKFIDGLNSFLFSNL